MMGVDHERLTYRQYQAILGEWNVRHDSDPDSANKNVDYSRLKKAMKAHSVH